MNGSIRSRRLLLAVAVTVGLVFGGVAGLGAAVSQVNNLWACVDSAGHAVGGIWAYHRTCGSGAQSVHWKVVGPVATTPTTQPATTTTGGATTTTAAPTTTSTSTTSTTTTTTQPPPGGTCPTTCLFDDEFSGTSVDRTKWPELNWFGASRPVNGAETACYDPGQTTVSGGYLHMVAQASTKCGMNYVTGFADTCVPNHSTCWMFTTGTMEARAYLPGTSSTVYNWPAIWTAGRGQWPNEGESDLTEGLGGRATCNYHSPSGAQACNAQGYRGGWHTFREVVTPGKVVYSYDGNVVGTIINPTVGKFPHYIILGNQMGQWGGPVVVPTEMLVDYVRVW